MSPPSRTGHLTAAPAAGGQSFTAWLTHSAGLTNPSWQLLCGLASICSIAATLSTQLLKSNNLEEKVTRATAEYLNCVEEVAFL